MLEAFATHFSNIFRLVILLHFRPAGSNFKKLHTSSIHGWVNTAHLTHFGGILSECKKSIIEIFSYLGSGGILFSIGLDDY